MRIYRVEHIRKKFGPYQGLIDGSLKNMLAKHSLYTKPTPASDEGLREEWLKIPSVEKLNYKFGFVSIEQLNDWFDVEEERQALHENGFVIRVYEVQKGLCGKCQAVFDDTAALRVPRSTKRLISNTTPVSSSGKTLPS